MGDEGAVHSSILILVAVPTGYLLQEELTRVFIPCFVFNNGAPLTVYKYYPRPISFLFEKKNNF